MQTQSIITFETVLKLVKQLSFTDQMRLVEWVMDQIKLKFLTEPPKHTRQARFGSGKGTIIMADDFDAPLEDFEEYMP
ncbi:DUF2281 domain-containing protein [Anaerolineales bacterium HSG6]|nr:DUF2281 domain-containing protein [Anaerolineales bacterium HSG6]MDM8529662.1 DUF2281 domain-containing protein [Anaerolineales bacterium HSG25]